MENVFDLFNPHGVRGVVLTAESHLAIHTWPEYGHAANDFTCDEVVGPWKVYTYLEEKLGAGHVSAVEMKRGQLDFSGKEITHKPAGY